MTDIVPVPNWGGVRQLETNEYATGGLNGNMNEQAKALAGQNMYSRLYAGLPFDPVFTARVGGFPIGGKSALESGDIVRSIVANNTVNPNVDMTGWVNETEELYVFRKPVIYAKNIKTDGTDQLEILNYYASLAASKKLELILPSGVISIADEFIPPDGVSISSAGGVITNASAGKLSSTVLKWIGANGVNKAVLRCSRSAIGVEPSVAISAVKIDISIDASGCDYGAYFRYFTNESSASLHVRNSNKCGIAGVQLWFCSFPRLISTNNIGSGISFGLATAGETGDIDVNAVDFNYMRAHSNGVGAGYSDNPTNIRKGAGISIKTRGCSYTTLQSEANYGVGFIEDSFLRDNFYGSIYVEGNCRSGGESIGVLNYGTNTVFNSLFLAKDSKIRNAATQLLRIRNSTKEGTDNAISITSVGKIHYSGNNYQLLDYLSPSDFTRLVFSNTYNVLRVSPVDIRYGSTAPLISQKFYMQTSANLYVALIPHATASLTKSAVLLLDGVEYVFNIVNPVVGVPIYRRIPVSTGLHTLSLGDAATTTIFECTLQIMYGLLPSGVNAAYIEI